MSDSRFADIILPFAVRGRFTYSIPDELASDVKPGVLVTVHFRGRNLYSGIVSGIHNKQPDSINVKPIINVAFKIPLINEFQLKLWSWISEYYLCSEGEVMKAAIPSELSLNNFKPRLQTVVKLSGKYSDEELNDILDKLKKAPRQQEILLSYLRLTGYATGAEILPVSKSILLSESHSSPAILEGIIEKGFLVSNTQITGWIDLEILRHEP